MLQKNDFIFGRFRIGAWIASGAQSFGFKGEDTMAPPQRPWEQPVFVKQYIDVLPGTQEARALEGHFRALRQRLKKKSHYLCLPIDIGEAKDSVIGIFEYAPGRSLKDWMHERLSQERRIRLACALSNAIRLLSEAGIAHLDLKPSNILVEEKQGSGQLFLRLIDIDAAQIDGVGLRSEIIGSWDYMSPEHIAPNLYGPVSERSDVFTLGILLFELLFKKYPFFGEDYLTSVQSGCFEVPTNRYHREVIERIITCLATDPKQRPKAGWVHSTLHKHHDTNLEANDAKDQWRGGSVCLDSDTFHRVYYFGDHLGRMHFRGSGILGLPSEFLRLYITVRGALVQLTDEEVDIYISGHRLQRGYLAPLRTGDILSITGRQFAVTVNIT